MKRWSACAAVVTLAVTGLALAADSLKSGLQVGESAGFFQVKDCSGPNTGRSLCYR